MNVHAPDIQMRRLGSSENRRLNIEGQTISNRTLIQQGIRVMEIIGILGGIYIAEGNVNKDPQALIADSRPTLRIVEDKKGRTLEVIK